MFIFHSRFRFAAVKNGNHCFCLSQIQENSRVNQSLCNLGWVLKLTSSSDISSIDYEKSPEKIHTSPMYRFVEILIGWGRKVRGG